MGYALPAALALLAGTAAIAQAPPAIEEVRINQLIVYGADTCPPSSDDEIIVCARRPEADRFRIPETLRSDPNDPASRSWNERAIELSYVGRSGIGSCSTAGAGGMIGCYNQLVDQARAERAGRDTVNWNRLIEEARQQRLDRIDAQAAADERDSTIPN